MDDIITMTIVEGVSQSFYYLTDLGLSPTPVGIFRVIEFSPLHIFHYYVQIIWVVVYLVHLNDIGMLHLTIRMGLTVNIISHSFL